MPRSATNPARAPRLPPRPAPVPSLDYPVVLAEPLFAPDRKPVAATPAQASLDGYTVTGIAISAETATVVMRAPNGKAQRVLYGGTLLGWKLASVDRKQIVFEKDGERRVLMLRDKPAEHGAAAIRSARAEARNQDDDDDDDAESEQ